MSDFQPPPTYAEVVLVDERTKKPKFNPIWLKWFVDIVGVINASGGGGGTILHNSLGGLQGGQANQYYHLNALAYAVLGGATNGTHDSTFTFNGGGGSTASLTLTWQKVGDVVTLHIPQALATTGAGSTALVINTALPSTIRPSAATQHAPLNRISNNGAAISSPGVATITTAGVLSILRDGASTAFTNAASAGLNLGITITYFVG